ncbi:MAG: hypothetical protein ACYDH2_02085 [Anaerolineaceae bacterium]
MTIWKLALTPGPWKANEGKIKDKEGNVLANYPFIDGDQINQNNAELMAAAPNLLAAAVLTIQTLTGLTTEQFIEGAANPACKALVDAIKLFVRQTDSNGFEWWSEYSFYMLSMMGISDEEVRKLMPDDKEFVKFKEYCARQDTERSLKEKPEDK